MKFEGRILSRSNIMSGISQAGNPWQKQILICETLATYPKKVALTVFNNSLETIKQLPDGAIIHADISVESREFNGKWYTDVYVQNIALELLKQPVTAQTPTQAPTQVAPQVMPQQAPQMPQQTQSMPQSYPQQMQQVPQAQPYAVQPSQPVQKQQVYPSHIQQLLEQPLPAPSRVQFVTQPVQQSDYSQIEDLPF